MTGLRRFTLATIAGLLSLGGQALAADQARATLRDKSGKTVGQATFTQTPNGVLVRVELSGVPAGSRAMHVHETGKCEPTFDAAGAHFAGQAREHGFLDPGGPHAGDLPNIHVPASGKLVTETLMNDVQLSEGPTPILDRDGAALVIHTQADDYTTDPSGDAGGRIACGVIARIR